MLTARRGAVAFVIAVAVVASMFVMPTSRASALVDVHNVDITVGGSPLGSVTTSPTLQPAFSPSIHDYVLRCAAGSNTVTVGLGATAGGSIQVGNQSGAHVQFTVPLGENAALVLHATDAANPTGPLAQYWVRCLPHDFPRMDVTAPGPVPPGWYLTGNISSMTSGLYAMVLDEHGTPVWYTKQQFGPVNVSLLPGNQLAWAPNIGPGFGIDPNLSYAALDLDTQTVTNIRAPLPPTDLHELLQLPNGHHVLIGSPLRGGVNLTPLGANFDGVTTIVDCLVEETDANGALVSSWRMSDHVPVAEALITPMLANIATVNGTSVADVFHCNSVDVDPTTGDYLVSARNMSAVFRVEHATGNVLWKLGGTAPTQVGVKGLTIVNDGETTISGQHDARFRPNGSVSMYDDHTRRTGAARGVEYAIDAAAGTATLTFQYAAPDGQPANATGGFRRSADGTDNVVTWGVKQPGSGFTEVNGAGTVLMNVTFPDGDLDYRTIKVDKSAIDAGLLHRAVALSLPPAGWETLGGVLTSAPAVASRATGALDVFVRGSNNGLYHKSFGPNGWSGWDGLGGTLTSTPAVASWSSDRLDVFVRGGNNQLYHRWYAAGRWGDWESLGGNLAGAPAVASWAPGRLDVFALGANGQPQHLWYDAGHWSNWSPFGGALTAAPAVAAWAPGRLDLFGRGTNNQLYHRWYGATGWSNWESLGGSISSSPAVASSAAGRLDVFARGTNNQLYTRSYDNTGWGAWTALHVLANSDLAVDAWAPGRLDVFVENPDQSLGHRFFAGSWQPPSG